MVSSLIFADNIKETMSTRNKKNIIAGLVFIIFSPLVVNAQFGPPDPCTDPDEYCPIDGGLSLLIAAGIGIGAKKAYDKKKKNTAQL